MAREIRVREKQRTVLLFPELREGSKIEKW